MNEENRTRVWLVKTPEDLDAVIVSFAEPDSDECAGIFLYEPGADPVEVDAVQVTGVATEFEHATITVGQHVDSDGVRLSYRPANHHWKEVEFPGDEMIALARRDADVATAVEEHETLLDNHEKLTEQTQALVTAVHEEHRATHEPGPIEVCGYAVCQAAREMDL